MFTRSPHKVIIRRPGRSPMAKGRGKGFSPVRFRRLPPAIWAWLGLAAALAILGATVAPAVVTELASLLQEPVHEAPQPGEVVNYPEPVTQEALHTAQNAAACPPPLQDPAAPCVVEDCIASGDTLSSILDPYIAPGELEAILKACKGQFDPTALRVGRSYRIASIAGQLQQFVYEEDDKGLLIVERRGDGQPGFLAGRLPIVYDVETAAMSATIRSSLFQAVDDMGEKPEIAVRLADIFACDVDFFSDIKEGDGFRMLVKKRFREGRPAGYSEVLAAEFQNQGKVFQGFLFVDETGKPGYFDAQGNSLKKNFLKAPLAFTRFTSGFSMARKHPVLGVTRAHPAVDYGAPAGTPVMAVCDGKVAFAGWGNGAGNYITLKHPGGYESNYLHLSRFAPACKAGSSVSQGQVIGYVGSTGLSTGPHLDFRLKKDGQWINPTKVISTRGVALSPKLMPAFKQMVAEHGARLREAVAAGWQKAAAR